MKATWKMAGLPVEIPVEILSSHSDNGDYKLVRILRTTTYLEPETNSLNTLSKGEEMPVPTEDLLTW